MEAKRTLRNLVGIVVGMFAFGWLLVPMYDVFCEITGLNGKVTGPSSLSSESLAITEQRELLVQFMTHNNVLMVALTQKSQMRANGKSIRGYFCIS